MSLETAIPKQINVMLRQIADTDHLEEDIFNQAKLKNFKISIFRVIKELSERITFTKNGTQNCQAKTGRNSTEQVCLKETM